jgi:FHA domain
MSTTCPKGHLSETADYCDQCGAPLENRSAVPSAEASPPASASAISPVAEVEVSPDTSPSVPAEPCPDCKTPRVGSDKFCEGCGYDFAAGKSVASRAPAHATSGTTGSWQAIVEADRGYFKRVAAEEIDFPSHCPPRTFVLDQDQIEIGRHSQTRGTQPQIDLSGAPEDPAVSHLHAILLRQGDGSYALMDPGSSNGTTLNDDPAPIAPNIAMPLADGDRIHLGAWTTITLRRVSADGGET